MKVKALIQELEVYPDDLEVVMEGEGYSLLEVSSVDQANVSYEDNSKGYFGDYVKNEVSPLKVIIIT